MGFKVWTHSAISLAKNFAHKLNFAFSKHKSFGVKPITVLKMKKDKRSFIFPFFLEAIKRTNVDYLHYQT